MPAITCSNCKSENHPNSKYCINCGYQMQRQEAAVEDVGIKPVSRQNSWDSKRKNKYKNTIGMFVGILAFSLSSYAVQHLFFSKQKINAGMMSAASMINSTCPIMVDRDTRLDNAVALPNNVLQYNYTLMNFHKADIDTGSVKELITPRLLSNVQTSPEMKAIRDSKATLAYNYQDMSGVYVMRILITPEMYL